MDLVSVVITTYKREPQIVERAIRSVVKQTYENIEIIVVDDSPSDYLYRDNVKQIVEKYKGIRPLLYLQHEKNDSIYIILAAAMLQHQCPVLKERQEQPLDHQRNREQPGINTLKTDQSLEKG